MKRLLFNKKEKAPEGTAIPVTGASEINQVQDNRIVVEGQELFQTEYDGYFITGSGDVFSTKSGTPTRLKGSRISRNRAYRSVLLQSPGHPAGKTVYVHRLIAETLIPNPMGLPLVNHIDGNQQNNCVDNLEWATSSENTIHAFRTGLVATSVCPECGSTVYGKLPNGICWRCSYKANLARDREHTKEKRISQSMRLTVVPDASDPDRANEMLALRKSGCTLAQIGKAFGCSRQRVHEYLKKHCTEVSNG